MTGILAAIYASLFLAFSQASLKKSFRELSPSVSFFMDVVFGIILWIPLSIYLGVDLSLIDDVLPYAIVSALLSEALYFYALSKGQLSITSVILSSYPIYTIMFSYIFNGEMLTGSLAIYIIVMILGTLITYLPSKLNFEEIKHSRIFLWPIIAAIGIGLSDTLSKGTLDRTSDFTFLFTLAIVQIPVSVGYLILEKQDPFKEMSKIRSNSHEYKNALAGSLFNVIGTGLLWIAFSRTLASIASPITATSSVIVIIIAVLFLDERIGWRQLIGILMVTIGVIGVSVSI